MCSTCSCRKKKKEREKSQKEIYSRLHGEKCYENKPSRKGEKEAAKGGRCLLFYVG